MTHATVCQEISGYYINIPPHVEEHRFDTLQECLDAMKTYLKEGDTLTIRWETEISATYKRTNVRGSGGFIPLRVPNLS